MAGTSRLAQVSCCQMVVCVLLRARVSGSLRRFGFSGPFQRASSASPPQPLRNKSRELWTENHPLAQQCMFGFGDCKGLQPSHVCSCRTVRRKHVVDLAAAENDASNGLDSSSATALHSDTQAEPAGVCAFTGSEASAGGPRGLLVHRRSALSLSLARAASGGSVSGRPLLPKALQTGDLKGFSAPASQACVRGRQRSVARARVRLTSMYNSEHPSLHERRPAGAEMSGVV